MIKVNEAITIIEQAKLDLGFELCSFFKADGRILRENIATDRDFPPFNRVTMDGIALRYEDFKAGIRDFPIKGICPAGSPQQALKTSGACLEVMTGAVMPEGVDVVIRYENLEIKNGIAKVMVEQIKAWQNVHFKGSDMAQNTAVLQEGTRLNAADIGILTSLGKAKVHVSTLPKTIVISTGDELVEVHQIPKDYQIRRSNVFTIQTALKKWGIEAEECHLTDNKESLEKILSPIFKNFELVILSGAVSKGKFDYVPEVLEKLGVKKHFHKVAQRPGKPFWFGTLNNTVVFALPGNPVSSFVCAYKYIDHWLNHSLIPNFKEKKTFARLENDVTFRPNLFYFLEVTLSSDESGVLFAQAAKGNGSGDLINLHRIDALVELPEGKTIFKAGESYPIIQVR